MAFTDRLHNRGSIGGVFQIENSTLIDFTRNEYLTRTHSDGSRTTGTISVWVKRGRCEQVGYLWELGDADSGDGRLFARFQSDDRLRIATGSITLLETYREFRDVSAWYHIVVTIDTTNSTGDDRVRLYINGERETQFTVNNANTSLNQILGIGNGRTVVGRSQIDNNGSFDGYLTEFNYIDGTAYDASKFGETHNDGQWIPKDITVSHGTQGCRLEMKTANAPGDDTSGNGNDFTSSGLGTQDQATDTPTNNFCTWQWGMMAGLGGNQTGFTGGNLLRQGGSNAYNTAYGTMWVGHGSWYWECYNVLNAAGSGNPMEAQMGIVREPRFKDNTPGQTVVYNDGANRYISQEGNGGTYTYGFHLDLTSSNPVFKIYRDGTLVYTKNSGLNKGELFAPYCSVYNGEFIANFGGAHLQDHGFSLSSPYQDENGYGNFKYQPPTGALALCTQNLATNAGDSNSDYTDINDASAHFQYYLYTGNGSSRSLTFDGNSSMQPDLIMYRRHQSNGTYYYAVDSTRGTTKYIYPNADFAEGTVASAYVTSFDSNGYSLGSGDSGTNTNGALFSNWVWKMNGGTTSTNTQGATTSTTQVNSTAQQSIVTWTGTGSSTTIGHGLSLAPTLIMIKNRTDSNTDWRIYHDWGGMGASYSVSFNSAGAKYGNSTVFNSTVPSTALISLDNDASSNGGNDDMIAYCFANKQGYFESNRYYGFGATDDKAGVFCWCGFKPAMVWIKNVDVTSNWRFYNFKEDGINPYNRYNTQTTNGQTVATDDIELLSNGFKVRSAGLQDNGNYHIFYAWAEEPFVGADGVPTTAR